MSGSGSASQRPLPTPRPGTEAQQDRRLLCQLHGRGRDRIPGTQSRWSRLSSASTAIFSRNELAAALGEAMRSDVDILNNTNLHTPHFFGLWVAQDFNDPERYLPFLLQGGLGMPDREYYLGTSAAMAAIRPQYQAHIAAVLKLAGIDAPTSAPQTSSSSSATWRRCIGRVWRRKKSSAGNNHWSRAQFYAASTGPRLARLLLRRRLGRTERFRGLAAERADRSLEAHRQRIARHLEGLFEVSRARRCRALFTESICR